MKRVLAVAAALALGTGCGFTLGDGHVVTRERTLEGITGIVNDSQVDVVVEPGSGPATLTVDENLQDDFVTTVTGGLLRIDEGDGLLPTHGARLVVYSESLRSLKTSGAGGIRTGAFGAEPELSLEVDGLGSITYVGEPERLSVNVRGAGSVTARSASAGAVAASVHVLLDGAGNVDTTQLPATDLDVTLEGLGSTRARIDGGHLRIRLDGAGSVTWYGTASSQDLDDDGVGRIIHGS